MATTIDLGKIRIKWKGDYDASLTYELLDVIKFKGDSYIFISTISASGKTPDTTSEWELMVSGGDQWSTGTAAPSGGNPGDMYLRTSDETIHENSGGTWSQTANLGVTGTNIEQLANVPALSSGKFLTNDGTNTSWATVDVTGSAVGGDVTGTVGNIQLAANSVGATEISTGAVGSSEIADRSIVAGDIAAGSITGYELANDTLTAINIATDAITSNELANSSVNNSHITGMASDKLSGALPAIDGSNLSGVNYDNLTNKPTIPSGGSILQMKSGIQLYTNSTSNSSRTPIHTALSVTINKIEADSHILVEVTGSLYGDNYGSVYIHDDVNGTHYGTDNNATHTHGNGSGDPYGYFAESRLIGNIGAGTHTFRLQIAGYNPMARTPGAGASSNYMVITEIKAGVVT